MRKFVVPWLELLNAIAAALAIAAFLFSVWKSDETWVGLASPLIILGLLLLILGYAALSARKQRYAVINRHLHGISQRCRISRSRINAGEDVLAENSKFRDDLGVILTHVAEIYTILTRSQCRAAIKAFRPLDDLSDWYVFTLARDHASAASHRHGDRRRGDERFDTLDKNPHLLSLFSEDVDSEDWECFNDVPRLMNEGRYASSSLLWKLKVSHAAGGGMDAHRLPYKSAMVALVRNNYEEAVAFLGVDCERPKAFRSSYDGPLLAAIAGYIGPLLDDALTGLDALAGLDDENLFPDSDLDQGESQNINPSES